MGVFHHGRGGMAAGAGGGWTQAERDERWHSAHFLLFFFCLQPQPMEWCHRHSEQDFHLPFSFCCRALVNRALKDRTPTERTLMDRALLDRTLIDRALVDSQGCVSCWF